jgi:hypothetical protein
MRLACRVAGSTAESISGSMVQVGHCPTLVDLVAWEIHRQPGGPATRERDLPAEILEAVDEIAREEKSTRSAIIRRMVADGVRRHRQKR